MRLVMIVETAEAERAWNGFRLANAALEAGHGVSTFLLGDGVEAPDLEAKANINPHGVIRKYLAEGGELLACGTCMDSRNLEPNELRPRAGMADLVERMAAADETITIG